MNVVKLILDFKYFNEVLDLGDVPGYSYNKSKNLMYSFESEGSAVEVEFMYIEDEYVNSIMSAPKIFSQLRERNKQGKIYNLAYTVDGVDGRAKKASYKEFVNILKTVVDISNDFVLSEKPFSVIIIAANKETALSVDRQKSMVYLALSNSHLPTGYSIIDVTSNLRGTTYPGVAITKKK